MNHGAAPSAPPPSYEYATGPNAVYFHSTTTTTTTSTTASHPPQSPSSAPAPEPRETIVVVNSTPSSRSPQLLTCPNCYRDIVTRTETRATTQTHLVAALLCLFQCYICAPFVYCCDECMAAEHYCPKCNALVGTFND